MKLCLISQIFNNLQRFTQKQYSPDIALLTQKISVQLVFVQIYIIIQMIPQSSQSLSTATSDTMQKVELYLSARNLLDMDVFSKSDPYIKLFFKRDPSSKQFYMGKTETINNNLNPNFNTTFKLDYIFQAHQMLRFEIFDYDNGTDDDFLGTANCMLGAVAGAKSQTLLVDIKSAKQGQSGGKLIIRLQTLEDSNQYIQMRWRAVKLMNTDSWFDFWDKSDPYLKFIKIRTDNTFVQVQRTQVVQNNLNPTWRPIEISKTRLIAQQNNKQGKFKVECWDWEQQSQSHHQFIGEMYVEYNKLQKGQTQIQFPLYNRKHKNPGKLVLESFNQIMRPVFMDYIKGGLQLNLSVAIDFTASNGAFTNPNSLHYINPYKPNQYQMAIQAISRILLNYDTDKRVPCYAFGGKPHFPNLNSIMVNHCFPLSGNPQQLQAFGMQHLMQMYNTALQWIELAGPTYFSFIMQQAIRLASCSAKQGSNCYQIMLILTDGEIHDMDKTINLLVENCLLPISFIIVGVGKADFTNMNTLDGDNGLYSSSGKKALRDIVQFVPFREVGGNPDLLAKELLAELPGQVVQYMSLINKPPNPPIQLNMSQIYPNSSKSIPNNNNMTPEQAMKVQLMGIFNMSKNL